jgi:hypothetical protein
LHVVERPEIPFLRRRDHSPDGRLTGSYRLQGLALLSPPVGSDLPLTIDSAEVVPDLSRYRKSSSQYRPGRFRRFCQALDGSGGDDHLSSPVQPYGWKSDGSQLQFNEHAVCQMKIKTEACMKLVLTSGARNFPEFCLHHSC